MLEPCETPEKADSESRSSTPRASSVISIDFDESSKSERHSRARSSRSSTPAAKSLRPRVKVSESPGSTHGEKYDDDDDSSMDEGPLVEKRKSIGPGEKLHDAYCWICHKELSTDGNSKECSTCVRCLHPKCIPSAQPGQTSVEPDKWECPECAPFVYEVPPRSGGTQEQLNVLFRYLIDRAVGHTAEPFMNPVDLKEFPQYMDYIIHPVCISQIEDKLSKEEYYSARELLTDFKWIYHNSVIFNSSQAKLTSIAKQMLRLAREEAKEIENCPNCLYNAYSLKPDWFIQACDRPHLLVWAKMKGFPYWPAKAMAFNQNQTMVDVRFFGKHDRAFLPIVDCMLYTSWYPAPAQVKKPREDVAACIKEVDQHIEKLKERFGMFVYASNITFLNPKDMEGQVKKMLPNYKPEELGRKRTAISPMKDQPGLTALKPSVVLTRLTDFESKVPSPLGSPLPAAAKSETSSRKNSVDDNSSSAPLINLANSPEKTKDVASPILLLTPAPTTTSAPPSTKVPLKRKIGPASKVGGQRAGPMSSKGVVETISLDVKDDTDEMTHELEALESVLNDSEDDIDNYIEDDIIEVPLKKAKQDTSEKNIKAVPTPTSGDILLPEKATSETSSSNNEPQQKEPKSTKPMVNKERQRKIAEGIKALDNLKIYGLDVVPVPVESTSAPMSPSIADMSSDSSEFIESDIEMEKESFKLEQKIEKVEMMEVEPDLGLPLLPPKSKPAPKSAAKKTAAKPANKSAEVTKKVPSQALHGTAAPAPSFGAAPAPKQTGQSILKSNNMPNKARKTLTNSPTSILSQRLAKPTPAAKRAATIALKKQIIVTQTVCAPQSEPLKLNVNVPPPDSAGPAVTMLNATAEKLADFMKQSVYSLVSDIAKNSEEDSKTENAVLKLQIELMKWQQTQAITEVARNHEISLQELDVLVEENALRARLECQRIANEEMRKAVTETKRKTWCAVCLLEASLYCCWNTSYCSVSCQKKHWLEHKGSCKLKTSNVHPNKPEVAAFTNGPSTKSVMYVATTMAQSNGTMMQTLPTPSGKKSMPQTMPAHAVFGTSAEITAALPQLLAVAPSQSVEKSESGLRPATHFLMTPASSQVKLPAAIHHTSLPPTIAGRTAQTVAKTSNAQVTNTPLFQFYKENTE